MSEEELQYLDWAALKTAWYARISDLGDTSGRVFHGRTSVYRELNLVTVDLYPPVVVMATYGPLPTSVQEKLQGLLLDICHESGMAAQAHFGFLHQQREGAQMRWQVVAGRIPEKHEARYLGMRFELTLGAQQNTGLFFDMQHGHECVRELSEGARVLNLFAYTCAFSLMALSSGALQVVNVDVSRASLARGRRNHGLNGIDPKRANFLPHNVMKSIGMLRRMAPFGVVIADPPSHQPGKFEARKDYPKLARHIASLLKPGGHLVACLNAPYIPDSEMQSWFSPESFRLIKRLGRPSIYEESSVAEDLKILHYQFEPASV